MRRILLAATIVMGLAAFAGGGVTLVQHGQGAQEAACVGNRTGGATGKCDYAWLNYSVESRHSTNDGQRVSCARGTATQDECYADWDDNRDASSGWGPNARTVRVPALAAGGVEFGGVTTNADPVADNGARVWTGVGAAGTGHGSAAVAAGRNAAGDPYACVVLFGADETPGHQIATRTNGAQNHPNDDFETDVSICGEFLRALA